MATPASDLNVIDDLVYQLYGDLLGASPTDIRMTYLAKTVNVAAAPYSSASLESITPALTRSPTSLLWILNDYGEKVITITANCAWKVTYSGNVNFLINNTTVGKVMLSGSSPTGVFGGSGTITIYRNATPGAYTGTVTITFSNGAGGSTTVTIALSSSG